MGNQILFGTCFSIIPFWTAPLEPLRYWFPAIVLSPRGLVYLPNSIPENPKVKKMCLRFPEMALSSQHCLNRRKQEKHKYGFFNPGQGRQKSSLLWARVPVSENQKKAGDPASHVRKRPVFHLFPEPADGCFSVAIIFMISGFLPESV